MLRRLGLLLPLLLALAWVQPASPPVAAASASPAPPGQPSPQDATLRLDWVPTPHHVGPVLALARGYYAAEGINLTIGEGTGSAVTVQAVAAGQDTFGFADAGTMTLAVSRGVPVIMVANTTPRSPIGVIYLPPTTIDRPQDLSGKTVGAAPGDASLTALPAVARLNGVDPDSYRIVNIEAATKIPALLQRRVDTIVGFRFGDYLRAWTENPDVRIVLYSDWGVNTLSNGYLVSQRTLQERPDLVRGFVRATIRGWKDVQADPDAGIRAMEQQFPTMRQDVLVAGVPMVLEHLYSDATRGHPLGWMAEQDWAQTVSVLHDYGGMDTIPAMSSLYTNDFVPQD